MPDPGCEPDAPPNRFYAYGVVARLALVAASIELDRGLPVDSDGEALEAELRG
jgi:glutamate--cysteine ligase